MSDTALIRAGRSLAAYAVLAAVVGTGLYVSLGRTDQMLGDWAAHNAVGGAAIAVLAWVIVPRQPRNGAVWALILSAAFQATNTLGLAIGHRQVAALGLPPDLSVVAPADLPLATALVLQVTTWVWVPGVFLLLTLGLVLFPDGRLPSPRWRWVVWWTVGSMATLSIVLAAIARPSQTIPAYGEVEVQELSTALAVGFLVGLAAVFVALIASLVGLVRRYRTSSGLVRQQFRWISWGASLLGIGILVLFPLVAIPSIGPRPMQLALVALFPVFIGSYFVAVARFRLYEIDRIISRTASYGIVTVTLAATYVALVLGLQVVLAPFTDGSELAVAGSTLLVAAAFVPVRNRAQSVVDRRFNRSAYDAWRAIDDFAQGMRDEVELDAVRRRLAAVAVKAVQPAHAGVWLAQEPDGVAATDEEP